MLILEGGYIVRLLYANGKMMDVPLSAVKVDEKVVIRGQALVFINGKKHLIKVGHGTRFANPELLYAICNSQVSKIE